MSETILLVEDCDDDAYLMKRALQKNNVNQQVVRVRDGIEAVKALFGWEGLVRLDPSVVLLDLNLPRLGGLEVLKLIRSNDQTRRLPVVIMTSSEDQQVWQESFRLGTNSFIRKHVDFDRLINDVRRVNMSRFTEKQIL